MHVMVCCQGRAQSARLAAVWRAVSTTPARLPRRPRAPARRTRAPRPRARRARTGGASGAGARARGGVRVEGFLCAQMAARLAVRLAGLERRLADEEVGVARELRDAPARPRVARVRERRGAVRDPEAVRLERVVRQADRAARRARRPSRSSSPASYSRRAKVRSNMSGKPIREPSSSRNDAPPRYTQSSGRTSPWPRR